MHGSTWHDEVLEEEIATRANRTEIFDCIKGIYMCARAPFNPSNRT